MYLKSKLAGVQLNRLYIPKYLAGFTARILNFILETPFVDTGKVDFIIEQKKGNSMTETQNIEQNLTDETPEQCEQIEDEETNSNKTDSSTDLSPDKACLKEALVEVSMLAALIKIKELDARVKALENKPCACKSSNSESEAQTA